MYVITSRFRANCFATLIMLAEAAEQVGLSDYVQLCLSDDGLCAAHQPQCIDYSMKADHHHLGSKIIKDKFIILN